MEKRPTGSDLLALLIKLYAEQEGVNISFEMERNDNEKKSA